MKTKTINWIKKGTVIASMAGIVTALGFGCGIAFEPIGGKGGLQDLSSINLGGVTSNDDLVIVAGQKTVATVYYTQVLDNMESVTGVSQLSQDTLQTFSDKIGSFSEYGSALSINAPMMLGFTSLGAEVCGDLLRDERPLAQNQRRIFTQVDFNQQTVSDAAIADMVRRMARSYWQRNETAEELQLVRTAVAETLALANDNNNNANFRGQTFRRGALRTALLTCSAMLSSTSAIEI